MKKDLNHILIRPRVTEKAGIQSEFSVYTFEIARDATKVLVKKAFEERYKITPIKVSTVTVHSKKVFVRGKVGSKAGHKKAYVYLKKGTKLETL
ncbi:MAG: 50S ribosomal protein L23 [Patescibacteria group bacterium]